MPFYYWLQYTLITGQHVLSFMYMRKDNIGQDRYMKRYIKTAFVLTVTLIFAIVSFGCRKKEETVSSPDISVWPEPSVSSHVSEISEEPDKMEEAVKRASEHGLGEDDLGGKYELFLRFSDTVEGNDSLGKWKGFVYRIFPAVADNAELLDEDYFMAGLSRLSIAEEDMVEGHGGEYYDDNKSVRINNTLEDQEPDDYLRTLFHELMHFVDYNLAGEKKLPYELDGRMLTEEELSGLSEEERDRAWYMPDVVWLTEAGAELFTGKYYSGTVCSYFPIVEFLTGLEHIYGEGTIKKMFFSNDTSYIFCRMLQDAGYSVKEIRKAAESLSRYTGTYTEPEEGNMFIEDILIDLYLHEKGDGWQDDAEFCYLLKCMLSIEINGYSNSRYEKELKATAFDDFDDVFAFEQRIKEQTRGDINFRSLPPELIHVDGSSYLTARGSWINGDNEEVKGVIIIYMDLRDQTVKDYRLVESEMPEDVLG